MNVRIRRASKPTTAEISARLFGTPEPEPFDDESTTTGGDAA